MITKFNKKYLTMHLVGGIGNQLFCYYAGCSISKKYSRDLKLDFTNVSFGHNFEDISSFPNCLPRRTSLPKKILKRFKIYKFFNSLNFRLSVPLALKGTLLFPVKEYEIDLIEQLSNRRNIHIEGYFQKSIYFQEIVSLKEAPLIVGKSRQLNPNSFECNPEKTLGVHVRRGDYLSHKNTFGMLSAEWYREAIAYALKLLSGSITSVFFFTNDSDWVSQNISAIINGSGLNVIIEKDSQKSQATQVFTYMTQCRGLVISNSTFSLMAAYHSNNAIFAPDVFFKNQFSNLFDNNFPKMYPVIAKWEN